LKKAQDELADVKQQLEKLREENSRASESQTLILLMQQKEEEYQAQFLGLVNRIRSLEEELQ
jgi:hypothetical protein